MSAAFFIGADLFQSDYYTLHTHKCGYVQKLIRRDERSLLIAFRFEGHFEVLLGRLDKIVCLVVVLVS